MCANLGGGSMDLKKKYMKQAMFLIVFTVFTWWLFSNFRLVGKGFTMVLGVLAPFIIGLVIAFILNKPMSFIEEKLFNKGGPFSGINDKYKRTLSFFMTIIIFILIIGLMLILVIPNLVEAGVQLAEQVPKYFETLQETIKNSSIKYSVINDQIQKIDFNEVSQSILSFAKGGFSNWIGSTFSIFTSLVGGFISIGIGFVFAIYFVLQKEELILSVKKLIYAVFPLKVAQRISYIGILTNRSFSAFITGQTLDALALGTLFLISMMIFKFPYALMVSVIITMSAFVPVVGSFVGLVIGAFLIFVEDPRMAGLFVVLFLVIQQIEGNLIYPKIVGKTSGLSSVWILAAVTLGGSLMGIVGIILFVPMFSVIQTLLKEYTDRRLIEKSVESAKV